MKKVKKKLRYQRRKPYPTWNINGVVVMPLRRRTRRVTLNLTRVPYFTDGDTVGNSIDLPAQSTVVITGIDYIRQVYNAKMPDGKIGQFSSGWMHGYSISESHAVRMSLCV
jgi:hypothetical protein